MQKSTTNQTKVLVGYFLNGFSSQILRFFFVFSPFLKTVYFYSIDYRNTEYWEKYRAAQSAALAAAANWEFWKKRAGPKQTIVESEELLIRRIEIVITAKPLKVTSRKKSSKKNRQTYF